MKDNKLLGVPIEAEWGGAGKDFLSATLCMEELSKVSPAVAGIINVSTEVVTVGLRTYGKCWHRRYFFNCRINRYR